MTLWRQDWNGRLSVFAGWLAISTVAASCLLGGAALAQATTERVVINRVSGYAISGFDPVAYFVAGAPVTGQNQYEFVYDRALWRFQNEGNLNAFRQHPEIYEPLFGGYDPVTVAQGRAVEGLPQIWAVVGSRLVLFSNAENREILLKGSRSLLAAASHRWTALRQELAE
jgi:hypothetical protein